MFGRNVVMGAVACVLFGCFATAPALSPTLHFPPSDACRNGETSRATESARIRHDACAGGGEAAFEDADGDGLADICEQVLAERFAPVVYHLESEPNFPTNVDAFLKTSALRFFDEGCSPDLDVEIVRAPTQAQLVAQRVARPCDSRSGPLAVLSAGVPSRTKTRTFFLADVAADVRKGSRDTREWTTYFHAHPNDLGGITLQFWRFYAFNETLMAHGGDWEGIHVMLDRSLQPVSVHLLQHGSIREARWSEMGHEGGRLRIFSEAGGHASYESAPREDASVVRQETWTGGNVRWPSGQTTPAGVLLNVGEKRAPLNGQVFLRYSGLWGSPGLLYYSSGYWGPAYNETSMTKDGFSIAWCAGMTSANLAHECCATEQSR